MSTWKTKLTKNFPCHIPLIGAPMAEVSGSALAEAVCRSGGLGFIAAGHLKDVDTLEMEIHNFPVGQYPLCIGFIGHSTFADRNGWDRFEYIMNQHKPNVVQFFAPFLCRHPLHPATTNLDIARRVGAKVFVQVGSVADAMQAVEFNVDGIMVQGGEAGGHGLRRELARGTLPLARTVVRRCQSFDIPIVAAGGISDGAGLAAVLALGCDGAALGTRLAATPESKGRFAQTIADTSSCDDVCRTTVLDQIQNAYSSTPWPEPYDSVGAVWNQTITQWEINSSPNELRNALRDRNRGPRIIEDYQRLKHRADIGMVHCGQGVGEINKVDPASELIERISRDAAEILHRLCRIV